MNIIERTNSFINEISDKLYLSAISINYSHIKYQIPDDTVFRQDLLEKFLLGGGVGAVFGALIGGIWGNRHYNSQKNELSRVDALSHWIYGGALIGGILCGAVYSSFGEQINKFAEAFSQNISDIQPLILE